MHFSKLYQQINKLRDYLRMTDNNNNNNNNNNNIKPVYS